MSALGRIFEMSRCLAAVRCPNFVSQELELTSCTVNFAFGYFVWLLDGWLCSLLTSMKHSAGLPLAFFLELHGWYAFFVVS